MNTFRVVAIGSAALLLSFSTTVHAQIPDAQQSAMNNVKAGDWRAAREIASTFAGNSSETIYKKLRVAWPEIANPVMRSELIQAFLKTQHPEALKIAALGLTDTDPDVRKNAALGLASALGVSNSLTQEQITVEVNRWSNKTLEQTQEARIKEIVAALRRAKPDDLVDILDPLARSFWRSPRLRRLALKNGILEAVRVPLLQDTTSASVQQAILSSLNDFTFPESLLQEIYALAIRSKSRDTFLGALNFLAHRQYRPAYDDVKQALVYAVASNDRNVSRFDLVENLASYGEPELVPFLIGLIASDNTYESIYGIGYFGLGALTGVPYNETHDGNWWKLWWEQHRNELSETVRNVTIPEFPRTALYQKPIDREVHQNRDAFRAFLIERCQKSLAQGTNADGKTLAILGGAAEIPTLIGLIASDNTSNSVYGIGYFGLVALTGVPYKETHDGNWWKSWYEAHRAELPESMRNLTIPEFPHSAHYKEPIVPIADDYATVAYQPRPRQEALLTQDCHYAPRVEPASATAVAAGENPADIADISSTRHFASGDKHKAYRLVGFDREATPPAGGYSLLVMLPGGDGSDEFRWFVRRIKKNALPKNMLVAQLIAPQWSEWQAESLVWPTRSSPYTRMKFTTESFIEETIADVKRQTSIAPQRIYALAWSSSGPAIYAYLGTRGNKIAGALVAMSIFRPESIPDATSLRGKRVYLYQSPQDFIPIRQARDAESFLKANGAIVQFEEYAGGHGWQGDTFATIARAIAFLENSTP